MFSGDDWAWGLVLEIGCGGALLILCAGALGFLLGRII